MNLGKDDKARFLDYNLDGILKTHFANNDKSLKTLELNVFEDNQRTKLYSDMHGFTLGSVNKRGALVAHTQKSKKSRVTN